MRRTVLILGALLAIGCSPAPAQKKFVVLDIAGARAPDLRDSVVDSVDRDYELVSTRTYRRTAEDLGVRRTTPRSVRKVARRLDVDYVLQGKVVRTGRTRWALHLRVIDDSGAVIGKLAVPLGGRTLSARGRKALERKLARTFAKADAAAEARARRLDNRRARTARDDRRRAERRDRRRAERRKRLDEQDRKRAETRRKRRAKAEERERREARARKSARNRADQRKAERVAARERKAREREERRARRAAPTKRMKQRLLEPEPEDDIEPVVTNDPLDEDGQAIDDEVPDALR